MKTRSVWLALALAVVVALSGIVSEAASAQTLTVYSSVDEENARAILNEFTKATGINVRFVFLSSGPALARLEAEQNNPQADIWMGAPSENHVLAKERGLDAAVLLAQR